MKFKIRNRIERFKRVKDILIVERKSIVILGTPFFIDVQMGLYTIYKCPMNYSSKAFNMFGFESSAEELLNEDIIPKGIKKFVAFNLDKFSYHY